MVIDSGDTGRGVAVSGTRASLEVSSAYFVSCRRLVSEDVRDFFGRVGERWGRLGCDDRTLGSLGSLDRGQARLTSAMCGDDCRAGG